MTLLFRNELIFLSFALFDITLYDWIFKNRRKEEHLLKKKKKRGGVSKKKEEEEEMMSF
jgi:hypothetical protein